jgi:hypothetical protein
MKDAKGHGSDERGGTKPSAKGMRLVKTYTLGPHSAKVYKNPEWGENVVQTFRNGAYQSKNDYHTDDLSDAHATAQSQLNRWAEQDAKSRPVGAGQAASELASGAKSATIPTHDSQGIPRPSDNIQNAASKAGYNQYGSRHGYNPDAVNKAIASSNRSGRRIGAGEASAIHRLLKGR